MKRFIVLAFVLFQAFSSLTGKSGNITIDFLSDTSLTLAYDNRSPYAPNDYYRNVWMSTSYLYTLGSNNIVQRFNKSNLSSAAY
jgi:hypothetical protein